MHRLVFSSPENWNSTNPWWQNSASVDMENIWNISLCIPKELQDLYLLVSLTIIACLISRFVSLPYTPPKKKTWTWGPGNRFPFLGLSPFLCSFHPRFFPKPVSTLYVFFFNKASGTIKWCWHLMPRGRRNICLFPTSQWPCCLNS